MATRLATHTMVAMVTTNLFLSQMAMLEASVSASFGKKNEVWKNGMRHTYEK